MLPYLAWLKWGQDSLHMEPNQAVLDYWQASVALVYGVWSRQTVIFKSEPLVFDISGPDPEFHALQRWICGCPIVAQSRRLQTFIRTCTRWTLKAGGIGGCPHMKGHCAPMSRMVVIPGITNACRNVARHLDTSWCRRISSSRADSVPCLSAHLWGVTSLGGGGVTTQPEFSSRIENRIPPYITISARLLWPRVFATGYLTVRLSGNLRGRAETETNSSVMKEKFW